MKVSFEGIGERAMTFFNADTNPAEAGKTVKMSAGAMVSACADGDKLAGLCIDADASLATVKTAGFVTASYTGADPAVGFASLAADAAGGVKVSAGGREYLVVEVDAAATPVGFIL